MKLMLHCGGVPAQFEELDQIPLPEATDSYQPVSHYDLAKSLKTIGQDILTDYILIGEDYGLARNGQQLFAVLKFQNDNKEMAMCIGFRNSYDRSMSIGMALGASVFVCDNLALTGEIAVMRKHTKNVLTGLEDLAISTLYRSQKNFQTIVEDSDWLKGIQLTDEDAYRTIGLLYGKDIISPRQIPVVKDNWLKPQHEPFKERNLWSFYNACTDAMKSSPPMLVMERHLKLHTALSGRT